MSLASTLYRNVAYCQISLPLTVQLFALNGTTSHYPIQKIRTNQDGMFEMTLHDIIAFSLAVDGLFTARHEPR